MNCVRLGVGVTLLVALATASWAQERAEPMQFAPDDVRPDAGAPPSVDAPPEAPAAAPQEEDREAAPITKGASKPAPRPAAAAAPAPARPAPPPPNPDKPKKQQAKKAPPPPAEPPPPAVPPHVTLHVWEPERANRFEAEETIESAMGEVLAADARLRFRTLDTILSPPDAADRALSDGDKALADAKQAYADMDLDKAKVLLETALKAYQKNLPALATRSDSVTPMRDGFVLLANVRFFEG